ncbi:MAG: PspC domain-containing protein [Candidatus Pacebacteria bacterium]|jgi:phage shock protein C|nr:PspC domain-containing protein [Candidatus Paceibacterota bacterium]MBP9780588.1 PspC domain-containing protein [Candidatus Paceibacterota bacterium]
MKTLYRSKNNKMVSGIFGGLGEYFDIDPVIFRIGFVIVMFVTGLVPAVIGYFVCLLIVPKSPKGYDPTVIHVKAEDVERKA